METPIIETIVGPSPETKFDNYAVGGGFNGFAQQPVHETITIAALIASEMRLDPRTTYAIAVYEHQYDTLEFFRGVVWNDDPMNELFWDNKDDNFERGSGISWAKYFEAGKLLSIDYTALGAIDRRNLIVRSHFGNLQFLHAMADKAGEAPQETQKKVLVWLEVMYKVAIGQISIDTKLRDVQIPGNNDQDRYPLRRLFDNDTQPCDTDTIHTLLTSNHKYKNVKHDRRALGSCLHIIQDSYARGHCRRNRLPGFDSPERFGTIATYHTYSGQNSDDHEHYDYNRSITPIEKINCANIADFKGMVGATDAIHACTRLINYWMNKKPWEGAVQDWFTNQLFFVGADATHSNALVDDFLSDIQDKMGIERDVGAHV
ncbi:hypothetical protein BGZ99_006509 [Dissophora globulifera]|uniref:Uncharacterized protein n=1 Tax=Dissophora globulifera TaxID=979702 RepID=A0A9P6RDC2_9FUNG|nr:hypothetical protein BGZ99_006509 [Dissophora globulifera]